MAALPDDQDRLAVSREERPIRLEPVPCCPVCGGAGDLAHAALTDRLCGVPGEWRLHRCRADGALWLNPRPIAADLGRCYPTTYFTHGSNPPGRAEREPGRQDRLRRSILSARLGYQYLDRGDCLPVTLSRALSRIPSLYWWATHHMGARMLPWRPKGRLLDVGCGNGEYLLRMQGYGWEVAGVEPDVEAARVAADAHGLSVHAGMLADAPFAERSFDAVVACQVLEHVPEPRSFLNELVRFLKPGGRLVIVTPNIDSLGHRQFGADFYALDPPRHLVLFTPRAARRLFKQVPGLRIISLRTPTHIARKMFKQGKIVRRTGLFSVPPVRITLAEKRGAALFSTAESAATLLRPLGEEIELVAELSER